MKSRDLDLRMNNQPLGIQKLVLSYLDCVSQEVANNLPYTHLHAT